MAQNNYKRRNTKRNNRKSNYKEKAKTAETREYTAEKPQNDPSWYTKYPQLVSDTSALWFSNPLGARIQRANYPSTTVADGLYTVPGIITLDVLAVPGHSDGPSSAINALSRGIYSFIRHANSGHANYDAPDLMMYLLAMDTCYSVWAMAVRAYGIARHYAVRNRYLGKQWLQALGFDSTDIIKNLAQFRGIINSFAVRLGSYAVPANMDYFRRHTDMYTKVFMDEPSDKAQAYAFKLYRYYQLELTGETGTSLVPYMFPTSMKVADVWDIMSQVLDPIIQDEDMNIMSGDVLKAFSESGIFKVPMISEEYETPFIFDETVLSQIENSMVCPSLNTTSLKITQNPDNGAIYFVPKFNAESLRAYMPTKILNLHHNNPSPIDIMEATRLMWNVQPTGEPMLTGFGSELVMQYMLWTFNQYGQFNGYTIGPYMFSSTATIGDNTERLARMSNLTQFNYHPRMTLWYNNGTTVSLIQDSFLLDNYTLLADDVLTNISNVAMLSLFDAGRIALSTQ